MARFPPTAEIQTEILPVCPYRLGYRARHRVGSHSGEKGALTLFRFVEFRCASEFFKHFEMSWHSVSMRFDLAYGKVRHEAARIGAMANMALIRSIGVR